MAQYKAPEELDRSFVKKYIEQVTVTLLDDGQAEIGLTMKTYEWKQMLGRIHQEHCAGNCARSGRAGRKLFEWNAAYGKYGVGVH